LIPSAFLFVPVFSLVRPHFPSFPIVIVFGCCIVASSLPFVFSFCLVLQFLPTLSSQLSSSRIFAFCPPDFTASILVLPVDSASSRGFCLFASIQYRLVGFALFLPSFVRSHPFILMFLSIRTFFVRLLPFFRPSARCRSFHSYCSLGSVLFLRSVSFLLSRFFLRWLDLLTLGLLPARQYFPLSSS
jgi:hypothetical protein